MKANRKFKEDGEAVSAVIGVILMVAITVAIAATVYVYVSGMLGGSPSGTATISLVDKGNYVQVTGITNGPVTNSSVDYRAIDTSTGANTSLTFTYNIDGDNIQSGDTIGYSGTAGTYNFQIVADDGSAVHGEVQITIN